MYNVLCCECNKIDADEEIKWRRWYKVHSRGIKYRIERVFLTFDKFNQLIHSNPPYTPKHIYVPKHAHQHPRPWEGEDNVVYMMFNLKGHAYRQHVTSKFPSHIIQCILLSYEKFVIIRYNLVFTRLNPATI